MQSDPITTVEKIIYTILVVHYAILTHKNFASKIKNTQTNNV
jgi:cell division protein FtsL